MGSGPEDVPPMMIHRMGAPQSDEYTFYREAFPQPSLAAAMRSRRSPPLVMPPENRAAHLQLMRARGKPNHLNAIFEAFMSEYKERLPTLVTVRKMTSGDGIKIQEAEYEFDKLKWPGSYRWGDWKSKKGDPNKSTKSLIIHLANDAYIYSDPRTNPDYKVHDDTRMDATFHKCTGWIVLKREGLKHDLPAITRFASEWLGTKLQVIVTYNESNERIDIKFSTKDKSARCEISFERMFPRTLEIEDLWMDLEDEE